MKRNRHDKAWMRQHVTDPYVQRAQQAGYRSRAAYKLLEIDARDALLRPGMVVVDLGAAPGSWSQVLRQKVGDRGRIIAIDLLPVEPVAGVTVLQADFSTDEGLASVEAALGNSPADLVLSDMAPNLTGVAVVDQARGALLAELALEFAARHLTREGALLVKMFQGGEFDRFRRAMAQRFEVVAVRKPQASRDRSAETYLLGRRKKLTATP